MQTLRREVVKGTHIKAENNRSEEIMTKYYRKYDKVF